LNALKECHGAVIKRVYFEAHNLMRRQAMSLQNSTNHVPVVRATPTLPVGGAILDQDGREILITEEMVQVACQECDKQWVKPVKQD
jgi:hypothetical protein